MVTKTRWSFAFAALLAVGVTSQATAQFSLVPLVGYDLDLEEFAVGAGFSIPVELGTTTLNITPAFELYPGVDPGSLWAVVVDATIDIPVSAPTVSPYVGGGVSIYRASISVGTVDVSDTTTKLNAVGGLAFGAGPVNPFVEASLRFIDGTNFLIRGGARIQLGG